MAEHPTRHPQPGPETSLGASSDNIYSDALSRCRSEIAEIRADEHPAWLAAMGELDWLIEHQLILEGR